MFLLCLPSSVVEALQYCHHMDSQPVLDWEGRVKVHATCSAQYSNCTVLFEPPDTGLPGFLASGALVWADCGTVYVPVVHVSCIIVLYASMASTSPTSQTPVGGMDDATGASALLLAGDILRYCPLVPGVRKVCQGCLVCSW